MRPYPDVPLHRALVLLVTRDSPSIIEPGEMAPFLCYLKDLALPFIETLGIVPINVSVSDAVECGGSVTWTSTPLVTFAVYDRYPCI
jgi:hypothetical protein